MITDGANKVVWRWDSDPFGADAANEDPDGDGQKFRYNLRFPGQYYDKETGLHYNYFRDYEPGAGRYVQSDPIELEGGMNTYEYAGGNPAGLVDPYGLLFMSTVGGLQRGTTLNQAVAYGGPGNAAAITGGAGAIAMAATAGVGYGYFGVLPSAARNAIGLLKGFSDDAMPAPKPPQPQLQTPPAISRPGAFKPPEPPPGICPRP